jgi:peroxisomal membrane protein 4
MAEGGVEKSHHAFLAGCIGGYAVFRKDNPVNNQIVMYLFARVSIGLAKLAYQNFATKSNLGIKNISNTNLDWLSEHGFEIEATVVWGLVMWLFTHYRSVLQPSLQASMQYLYNDSECWDSLWTLLVHNK